MPYKRSRAEAPDANGALVGARLSHGVSPLFYIERGAGGGAARAKAKHLAVGAVDYVCLLGGAGLDNAPLESQ